MALLGDDGDPVQHALARIDLSRELDPREAAALFRSVFERAEASELFGAASKALLYEIEAVLRAGDDLARVTALAVEAEQRFETRSPIDCYRGEILWPLYQAHAAAQSARAFTAAGGGALGAQGRARTRARAVSRFVPTPPAGQPSAARERRLRVALQERTPVSVRYRVGQPGPDRVVRRGVERARSVRTFTQGDGPRQRQ